MSDLLLETCLTFCKTSKKISGVGKGHYVHHMLSDSVEWSYVVIDDFFIELLENNKKKFYVNSKKDKFLYIPDFLGEEFGFVNDRIVRKFFKIRGVVNSDDFYRYFLSFVHHNFSGAKSWFTLSVLKGFMGNKLYDERFFYRLIALNEFYHNNNDTVSFKTFCNANDSRIVELVKNLNYRSFGSSSDKILDLCVNSPLCFKNGNYDYYNDFVNSLTLNDLNFIVDNYKLFNLSSCKNSSRKVLTKLENYIDFFRSDLSTSWLSRDFYFSWLDNIYSDFVVKSGLPQCKINVLDKFYSELVIVFKDIFDVLDCTVVYDIFKVIDSEDFKGRYSVIDFLCLLISCFVKNSVFSTVDSNDCLSTVFLGLVSKNSCGFVNMVKEIVIDHIGVLPSCVEWRSMIFNEEQNNGVDYNINATIFINLITGSHKTILIPDFISRFRNSYRMFE